MDERLQTLLEKVGTEGKVAWEALVQQQLAADTVALQMCLIAAAIVFITGCIVAPIVAKVNRDKQGYFIIAVGFFVACCILIGAASNYIDMQQPGIQLLKTVLR